jgi:acyl-CoA synthetase (AMP-forming)/AMP-acid ligase II
VLGHADLSPVNYLLRSARVYGGRPAMLGERGEQSYAGMLERTRRLAGALRDRGVGAGDRVATILPNVEPMLEAHFAVPGSGAVLVPLNYRLAAPELRNLLAHSGARAVIADREFADRVEPALDGLDPRPEVLWCDGAPGDDYDRALAAANPLDLRPAGETSLLSINYTSGTTGAPKGVMYTHRGAALHSLGVIAEAGLSPASRYLWTLPMFHCNGWAYTWAVTATGGRHVCLRRVDPSVAWEQIEREGVTHLCGAPTVLRMLLDGAPERPPQGRVRVFTGGAPPAPALLRRCEQLGWDVTHLYGLTETYGPLMVCAWHPEWDALDAEEQARLKARQGVPTVVTERIRVVDRSGEDVPSDGRTLGEVVMRGNNVTIGYYRNEEATQAAFTGDWFHSGDVGVMHPDGYIELRDRMKDIIISGGENISSIEVEQALVAHPDVSEAAVIGVPHEKWGETPKAYVTLRPGAELSPDQVVAFARERLAGFKVPRAVEVLDAMPTTPTGKIQKFVLRERGESAGADSLATSRREHRGDVL